MRRRQRAQRPEDAGRVDGRLLGTRCPPGLDDRRDRTETTCRDPHRDGEVASGPDQHRDRGTGEGQAHEIEQAGPPGGDELIERAATTAVGTTATAPVSTAAVPTPCTSCPATAIQAATPLQTRCADGLHPAARVATA